MRRSTTEAQTPISIRKVYPRLPRNIGALLKEAEKGKSQDDNDKRLVVLFDRLDDIKTATEFDPWHRANLDKIFSTRYPLRNRERLAVRVVQALDTVRTQAVPGAPFLARQRYDERKYLAGKIGPTEEATDFRTYPGLYLKLKGYGLHAHKGEFPDFSTGPTSHTTVALAPEDTRDESVWQFILDIAKGTGHLALGADTIRHNVGHSEEEDSFYAAMTLELAGVNPGVRVKPKAASRAGNALVGSMVHSLAGIPSPDSQPRIEVDEYELGDGHRHVEAKRSRSLQNLPLLETRAFLRVVGIDESTLRSELIDGLRVMANSETASSRQIAGGLAGQLVVGKFVERVFV